MTAPLCLVLFFPVEFVWVFLWNTSVGAGWRQTFMDEGNTVLGECYRMQKERNPKIPPSKP